MEIFDLIIKEIDVTKLNELFVLGLALFGGTIGGRFFQRIKVPQVVGYIIIGIIIGQSGFGILSEGELKDFELLSYLALGLIGFMIGGELKKEVFAKYGKQFMYILFFEGFTAFVFVFSLMFVAGLFLFDDINMGIALALLLGAIASATAPAATTDVLWEYKTRGPLTTTILGIVALDDAFALLLFALASSVANSLVGINSESILTVIIHPLIEIFSSIGVGLAGGIVLARLLKKHTEEDKILAFSIGGILIVIGLAIAFSLDMLIAAMTMGACLVNIAPRKSKEVFKLLGRFNPPIFVLFFVLVGANLNVSAMTYVTVILTVLYFFGRTGGKMLGATFGAKISGAAESVRKYLPYCLFSQAGVAIGLSILAGQKFQGDIGNSIIVVITASTFIVQLLGPPFVKYAVTKAGEVGLNVTDEDIVKEMKTDEIIDRHIAFIHEETNVKEILKTFSHYDHMCFPVVDHYDKLVGLVTIENIKDTFITMELNQFIIAIDIMEPVIETATDNLSVSEIIELMNARNLEYIPVVNKDGITQGIIERRDINNTISKKKLKLQHKLDAMQTA